MVVRQHGFSLICACTALSRGEHCERFNVARPISDDYLPRSCIFALLAHSVALQLGMQVPNNNYIGLPCGHPCCSRNFNWSPQVHQWDWVKTSSPLLMSSSCWRDPVCGFEIWRQFDTTSTWDPAAIILRWSPASIGTQPWLSMV